MATLETDLEPIQRLTKDLSKAARDLSPSEARYLVDAYYQIQDYRKAAGNQVKALTKSGEPCSVIAWLGAQMTGVEGQIKRALNSWTDAQPMGKWAKGITGIGPVIAAGLLAHIDITKAPTVGHIWRFAGLDPTVRWDKGQKRPWNADLKVLCWKIGQSFVKVSGHPDGFYGRLYLQRKEYEWQQNLAGRYVAQAEATVERKRIGHDTEAYRWYSGQYVVPEGFWEGYSLSLGVPNQVQDGKPAGPILPWVQPGGGLRMLPPAHIQQRAERYAAKLFLSHWHAEAYRQHYGTEPPKPYPIAILGHAHEIDPPKAD